MQLFFHKMTVIRCIAGTLIIVLLKSKIYKGDKH